MVISIPGGYMISIDDRIDERIEEVRTETLDMSFGEIVNLHKAKELIIEPEYQRLFRWSNEQKSRLIESISFKRHFSIYKSSHSLTLPRKSPSPFLVAKNLSTSSSSPFLFFSASGRVSIAVLNAGNSEHFVK